MNQSELEGEHAAATMRGKTARNLVPNAGNFAKRGKKKKKKKIESSSSKRGGTKRETVAMRGKIIHAPGTSAGKRA